MTPQPIAEIRSWDDLVGALRKHFDDLDVAMNTIDEVAGLPVGYAAKLLAPVPVRSIGPTSLGPLLGCGGVKLQLVIDVEAFTKIGRRLKKRKYAGWKMPARSGRKKRRNQRGGRGMHFTPETARIARAKQLLRQSPRERQQMAKRAARMRWRTPRVVEITESASRTASSAASASPGQAQPLPGPDARKDSARRGRSATAAQAHGKRQ